jgi:drug/metabolite transporter (DMT)-like permease
MMPFTAMLLSVLLLGEHAGLRQWAGGALVIAGIILIGISKEKQMGNG